MSGNYKAAAKIIRHTHIDYVSFSMSPTLLLRLREMAKQKMKFDVLSVTEQQKAHGHDVDNTQLEHDLTKHHFIEGLGAELGQLRELDFGSTAEYEAALTESLDNSKMVIAEGNFSSCYQDLIGNIGIDMLDSLCHAQVEQFIALLNIEITHTGNIWEARNDGRGFAGYAHSRKLMVNGKQAGLVAWGAKNYGCYVSFSGLGCSALNTKKLHDALTHIPSARITRLDIAHDCYNGKFDVHTARKMAKQGLFVGRGKPPGYHYHESGNLVKRENTRKYGLIPKKGRALYLGDRRSGKLIRIYEKGKHLKSDDHPNWVRWEVEIHNKHREIPVDALLESDKYFAGAYPALTQLFEVSEHCPIKTVRNAFYTSVENALGHAKVQFGKTVNFMSNIMGLSPYEIVERLTAGLDETDLPERLNIPIIQSHFREVDTFEDNCLCQV